MRRVALAHTTDGIYGRATVAAGVPSARICGTRQRTSAVAHVQGALGSAAAGRMPRMRGPAAVPAAGEGEVAAGRWV